MNKLFVENGWGKIGVETWSAKPKVDKAYIHDVMQISAIVQSNFLHHPSYTDMSEEVKADYLRANNYPEFIITMSKPGTHTFVIRTPIGVTAMMLARVTSEDRVASRLAPLNGSVPTNLKIAALDIRRLHTSLGWEGKGYATKLLDTAEKLARELNLALLISDATFPARSFFEKHGFSGVQIPVDRQNGSQSDIFRCIKAISL